MGVNGHIFGLMLRSDALQITPEILMLGPDLAEALHCYLAKSETNTDLRHVRHRSVLFCPVPVMQPSPAVQFLCESSSR